MEYSWIEPGVLAAGSVPVDAKDILSLHDGGVRGILSLTERALTSFWEISAEVFAEMDIKYFHVPIPDQHCPSEMQAGQILGIIRDMATEIRPMFIHCNAGVGRTGTILHLYYLSTGKSMEEAQALIRKRRIQCVLLSDVQLQFLRMYDAKKSGHIE